MLKILKLSLYMVKIISNFKNIYHINLCFSFICIILQIGDEGELCIGIIYLNNNLIIRIFIKSSIEKVRIYIFTLSPIMLLVFATILLFHSSYS